MHSCNNATQYQLRIIWLLFTQKIKRTKDLLRWCVCRADPFHFFRWLTCRGNGKIKILKIYFVCVPSYTKKRSRQYFKETRQLKMWFKCGVHTWVTCTQKGKCESQVHGHNSSVFCVMIIKCAKYIYSSFGNLFSPLLLSWSKINGSKFMGKRFSLC